MDRKFQSDEQWYVSPLLDLKNVKEDLLECRQSAEDTLYRDISDDSEKESEKEKDNALWTENLIMSAGVSEEQATEAVEEVSKYDFKVLWDYSQAKMSI
uniref:Small nuclear RNA-activating complex polypeptide 3 n=2 Tax=Caenorhabditis japonica TaxID=281687 RepID=A0A8R1J237_CAEJA